MSYLKTSYNALQVFYHEKESILYCEKLFTSCIEFYGFDEKTIIRLFEHIIRNDDINLFNYMISKYIDYISEPMFRTLKFVSVLYISINVKYFETFMSYHNTVDLKPHDFEYYEPYSYATAIIKKYDIIISLFIKAPSEYFINFMNQYPNIYNYKNIKTWKRLLDRKHTILGPKLSIILTLVPDVFKQINIDSWVRIIHNIQTIYSEKSSFQEKILERVFTKEYILSNINFFINLIDKLPLLYIEKNKIAIKIKEVCQKYNKIANKIS